MAWCIVKYNSFTGNRTHCPWVQHKFIHPKCDFVTYQNNNKNSIFIVRANCQNIFIFFRIVIPLRTTNAHTTILCSQNFTAKNVFLRLEIFCCFFFCVLVYSRSEIFSSRSFYSQIYLDIYCICQIVR